LKKIIFILFIISILLISYGLFFESAFSQKLIGFGTIILFFIVFPLFSYYRWKDKKIEDYYLNNENLKKFKENNDL
tara:strand:+ start:200 stop:427 length:228 start_codon:yes stop_codon:yes gene_type:complete